MTVVQNISNERLEATIQAGAINGQVAIGQYVLQIGDVNGGVVNIALPEQQPGARARPAPVDLRPRLFRGLLDRKALVETASAALQAARPVELAGQEGIGKSSLLRHLAHQPLATSFAGGVVYLSARRQGVGDLRLALFDAFYDRDMFYKPTETQIKVALRDKKALILLDDHNLTRADLEQLMDAAPDCTFLLASLSGHLWGEGHVLTLSGLPVEDGLVLLAREMGRPLSPAEGPAAKAIWRGVSGHPLFLILAGTAIREEGLEVAELARLIQSGPPEGVLAGRLVDRRPAGEKRALAVLAALGGAPASPEQIASVAGLSEARPVLESLSRDGLVQVQDGRYTLSDLLARILDQTWELAPWRERLLDYFVDMTGRWRPDVGQLLDDVEAIMQTTAWALQTGRWTEVTGLVKAIEGALAQSGRWDAWSDALGRALAAAQAAGDQSTAAWALHQIGSRALCLKEKSAARVALIQALRLREALGDVTGAAVTRHNLRILLGPPPPPRKPPGNSAPPPNGAAASGSSLLLKVATVLLFVTTVTLAGLLTSALADDGPPALPAGEPLALATITQTATRLATVTSTVTQTPSATATNTATATATATVTATATATATTTSTATPTATATSTPCGPPWNWLIYVVRRGDTLFSIGQATGASVAQLKLANCLVGDRIDAGQNLFVPRLPLPTPTYTATEITRIVSDEPTPTNTPPTPIGKKPLVEEATPTDTPTPTPSVTPIPTPSVTPTPTDTPTPTNTPCPGLIVTKFVAEDTGEGIQLEWATEGGCLPVSGELAAQYNGDERPYKVYTILKPNGVRFDFPAARCGGIFTILYELKLTDGSGQSGDAWDFVEMSWDCPA